LAITSDARTERFVYASLFRSCRGINGTIPRNVSQDKIMTEEAEEPTASERPRELILEDFLPYRLSILSNTVSSTIASTYDKRFEDRKSTRLNYSHVKISYAVF